MSLAPGEDLPSRRALVERGRGDGDGGGAKEERRGPVSEPGESAFAPAELGSGSLAERSAALGQDASELLVAQATDIGGKCGIHLSLHGKVAAAQAAFACARTALRQP